MKTTLNAVLIKLTSTPVVSSFGAIFAGAISFMFDGYIFFYMLTGAIILDAITGITASLKNGDKLESRRIGRSTFEKLIGYGSVLLVMAAIDYYVCELWGITEPKTGLHILAIGWVLATESISILENCQNILNMKIPFLNKFRRARKSLNEFVQKKGFDP